MVTFKVNGVTRYGTVNGNIVTCTRTGQRFVLSMVQLVRNRKVLVRN